MAIPLTVSSSTRVTFSKYVTQTSNESPSDQQCGFFDTGRLILADSHKTFFNFTLGTVQKFK